MTLLWLEITLSLVIAFLAGAVLLTWLLGRGAPRAGSAGWLWPLAVLGGLALLALLCVPRHGVAIQEGLRASTSTLLGEGVTVRAYGRDLVLTGQVSSPQARTLDGERALAQPGVRTVTNLLEVASPPPPVPAAAPPVAEVQAKLTTILEARRIEFQPSSAILTAGSLPVLEEVRGVLAGAPGLALRIEGHTDDRGDAGANRALSRERARTVADWLAAHGIERGRLEASGFGPDHPLAPNTSPDGRARNRRVELIAH